jgi:hypothetical protein
MVTISYSLTPEDLAELEAGRRGGFLFRILRIPVSALVGFIGLFIAWSAIFLFPWNTWDHRFWNPVIAVLGLFLLWVGLDWPGLTWLLNRFSDPYAPQELCIYEGKIVSSRGRKIREFRWYPKRGFKESQKFLFLRSSDNYAKWAIPKRTVSVDQEQQLRGLVERELVGGDIVECRFFLTQEELNEVSCHLHPWLGSKYGNLVTRAVGGAEALFIPLVPKLIGSSWAREFRTEPMVAAGLIGFGLFLLWAVSGCPGSKALNRLDLERRITISDPEVEVTRGTKTSHYGWHRFVSYLESPNLFVLRTRSTAQFWTIPKRALSPAEQESLRALLDRNLPRR